jgi:hypothetical protein
VFYISNNTPSKRNVCDMKLIQMRRRRRRRI